MCDGEIKGMVEIIRGDLDGLIIDVDGKPIICEICLKRLELMVQLLREEIKHLTNESK